MNVKVYQIDRNLDKQDRTFMSHKDTLEKCGKIDPAIYKCVYEGKLNCSDTEDVYVELNISPPPEYQGHALSVSDILEVKDSGEKYSPGFYFCDDFGYKKLDKFDTSQCAALTGARMLVVLPGREPYEARVNTDIKMLQMAVQGYIECSYPFKDSVYVIGNDEAKLTGMPGNRRINGALYAGPILIAGDNGHGGTRDLTDEEVKKYTKMLLKPQQISEKEIRDDLGFRMW